MLTESNGGIPCPICARRVRGGTTHFFFSIAGLHNHQTRVHGINRTAEQEEHHKTHMHAYYIANREMIAAKAKRVRDANRDKRVVLKKQCVVCNTKFTTTRPRRIYCSGTCRDHAHYLTRLGPRVALPEVQTCLNCGIEFHPVQNTHVYCSKRCTNQAQYRRRITLVRAYKQEHHDEIKSYQARWREENRVKLMKMREHHEL
jgi:predicted nucleic acid-binding Zn ribbon protein